MKHLNLSQKLILIASSPKGANDRFVHWFQAGEVVFPLFEGYIRINLESPLAAGCTVYAVRPPQLNQLLLQLYAQGA